MARDQKRPDAGPKGEERRRPDDPAASRQPPPSDKAVDEQELDEVMREAPL